MISSKVIIGILVGVICLFTVLGIVYSKGKISGSDDFFTARNSAGPGVLSTTFMASFLGVFILFTPPEAGAIGGISTVVLYAIGLGGLYLAFLTLGPKVRTYLPEGSTLNDYVKKRYGKQMMFLTFAISIFYMMVHLVAELTAIALVAEEIAGVNMLFTGLVVGIGVAMYISYGGLKASMFTDSIQVVLVVVLLGIVTIGVIYFVGSPDSMAKKIMDSSPELLSFNNNGGIEFGLTLMIAVFVANLFHQGYWQRIYAGKDEKALSKSLKISIFLAVPIMLIVGILGIVSTGLGYSGHPSVAMFSLIYSTFPTILIVVVFVLSLVLVMSTVDTLLNALITSFAIDTKSIERDIDKDKVSKNIKGLALLIILPSAYIASKGFSVLSLFLLADLLCAGLVVPLFYGLYQPKITERVALFSSVIGIVSGIPFFLQGQMLISFVIPIAISSFSVFLGVIFESRISDYPQDQKSLD